MTLRTFATFLAAAVLAACEGSTLPTTDARLTGGWTSPIETVPVLFPDGTHTTPAMMRWSFTDGGRFQRVEFLVDPSAPSVIELWERGTYVASNGRIDVHVDSAYTRGGAAPAQDPALLPANRDAAFAYTVQDDQLMLNPICPPGAMCIIPIFTHYTRDIPID